VLYVLDGGVEQDFHHISGLAQLASVNGATRELIVVGIETQDRRGELAFRAAQPRYAQEWPTHGRSAEFRRHLEQEVIPFVEKGWRTSGDRTLMGESLAGLFVVETLLRQPGLFDRHIAISPSLWWDGGALVREAPALLARHDAGQRTLWLATANEGKEMAGLTARLTAALKARAPASLRWTWSPRPKESHATIYHPAALDAIRTFWTVPPEPEGPCPWWLCPPAEAGQGGKRRPPR
jgi:predicted alpha/beta superfamily hydrolase